MGQIAFVEVRPNQSDPISLTRKEPLLMMFRYLRDQRLSHGFIRRGCAVVLLVCLFGNLQISSRRVFGPGSGPGFGHDYKSKPIARNHYPKQRFTHRDTAILALHRSLSRSVATV